MHAFRFYAIQGSWKYYSLTHHSLMCNIYYYINSKCSTFTINIIMCILLIPPLRVLSHAPASSNMFTVHTVVLIVVYDYIIVILLRTYGRKISHGATIVSQYQYSSINSIVPISVPLPLGSSGPKGLRVVILVCCLRSTFFVSCFFKREGRGGGGCPRTGVDERTDGWAG